MLSVCFLQKNLRRVKFTKANLDSAHLYFVENPVNPFNKQTEVQIFELVQTGKRRGQTERVKKIM